MFQVGVDCEEISRFRRLPYNKKKNFYKRIFTRREIEYCISCRNPYPRFTARFAAKEAVVKALAGIAGLFYSDIEVRINKNGRPEIYIDRKKFKEVRRFTVSLSLTHSNSHAIAFAVVANNKTSGKETMRALRKDISLLKKKLNR
ncbi:MAG: holo-ACP synthase [Candidatus Omnitrophota bacterium]|nr:holo-ACP synthase [Candidatus Omnitrophota bacterium]